MADKEVNTATEKAIKLTEKIEKTKFKKALCSIVFGLAIILLIVSLLFMYNTYNKYQVYDISSANEDFIGEGNIVLAKEKSIITLVNLSFSNKNISDKNCYAIEYSLTIGDFLIYHYGDIYSLEDNSNNKINIGKYVEEISIHLTNDIGNMLKSNVSSGKKLLLNLKYINEELEIEEYSIEFTISKSFSNDRIIVSKTEY